MKVTMHMQGDTTNYHTVRDAVEAFSALFASAGLADGTEAFLHTQVPDCAAATCPWRIGKAVRGKLDSAGRVSTSIERTSTGLKPVPDREDDDSLCRTSWCDETSEGGDGYEGFCPTCADRIQRMADAVFYDSWERASREWDGFDNEEDALAYLDEKAPLPKTFPTTPRQPTSTGENTVPTIFEIVLPVAQVEELAGLVNDIEAAADDGDREDYDEDRERSAHAALASRVRSLLRMPDRD